MAPWLCTFSIFCYLCLKVLFHFRKNKGQIPAPPPLYLNLLHFLRQNFLLVLVVPCAQTSSQVPLLCLSWCLVICRLRSAASHAVKLEELCLAPAEIGEANGCVFTAPVTKRKIRSSLLLGKWHCFCIIFPKALAFWFTWKRQ